MFSLSLLLSCDEKAIIWQSLLDKQYLLSLQYYYYYFVTAAKLTRNDVIIQLSSQEI